MHTKYPKTLVIGGGSWGTALAVLLARKQVPTLLWARDDVQVAAMAQARCNERYLPQISFPSSLDLVADLDDTLSEVEQVLVVVPSRAFRPMIERLAGRLPNYTPLIWATKGLEPNTGRLLHEVVAEVLGTDWPMAVISGPTFAYEVAIGLPTAITITATQPEVSARLASCFHGDSFRAYTSEDLIGVQIGGAIKISLLLQQVLAMALDLALILGRP